MKAWLTAMLLTLPVALAKGRRGCSLMHNKKSCNNCRCRLWHHLQLLSLQLPFTLRARCRPLVAVQLLHCVVTCPLRLC
jgi:hypothetical protein